LFIDYDAVEFKKPKAIDNVAYGNLDNPGDSGKLK
jgi:hypothetical protein